MENKKMREYEEVLDERKYTEERLSELFEITLRLENKLNRLIRM